MFDEIKKPLGENLALYPTRRMARGLIKVVCHSSVLVSYIFLEIQVTEEWSGQLD